MIISQRSQLDALLKIEKKKKHRELLKDKRRYVMFLDIILIVAICLNFTTVFMTNFLVVKETPPAELVLVETNPITAEVGGYVPAENGSKLMLQVYINVLAYVMVFVLYNYYRQTMYNLGQLVFLSSLVFFFSFMLTQVFFNDFGYFVGRLLV